MIGSALPLLSLLLISTPTTGFLHPHTPQSLTTSSSTPHPFGVSSLTSTTGTTTTPLRMGVMEDFMSGKDDSIRTKENAKFLADLDVRVERINALEAEIEELEDDELMAKTVEFRGRLEGGEDIDGVVLEEAFAVVREAAWRVLELRHYDVQLLGGLILHAGRLAEMATGEGKTLVSTLPCYLNALTGTSAFVITVNDYLARRDMEKMSQIYRFLGLTVGLVQSDMDAPTRRTAYACDVVYVTNSELGFDYLRDNLALSPDQTVLPRAKGSGGTPGEFDGFCVVDEADSVLIDEARTPLIISKQIPAPAPKYEVAQTIADALFANVHYVIDIKNKNVILNEKGYRDCENALGIDSLFGLPEDGTGAWAPFIINAVKAKELFEKDVEYSVLEEGGKKVGVGIIDAFTGRVLEGRRWSDGLHQSIEAMEGIEVSQQSKVIAKVTYQALFRQFTRLSGMTGTALTDASELSLTYDLTVTPVPTALPIARRDYPDVSYKTRRAADAALIKEIIAVGGGQPDGRPCLVGTTSVAQSEQIVRTLKQTANIDAELLNASPKNAPRESEIVAQAGRAGVVTVATNMAGRGTDILLGGCPATMSRIKTRSVLVDRGVLAEGEGGGLPPAPAEGYFPCGIEGDVTAALEAAADSVKRAFGEEGLTVVALEDTLTVATDTTEAEDDPEHIVALRDAIAAIKETYRAVLSDEKEAVVQRGGLYVMGTNRHESGRIDGQLRGRAGRQGDPGSSRFFLSFEDDMFVVFGGDGLKKILETFRVSEDMPVEAPQVTEALDRVQSAVEENYRDIREQILQFDVVLNDQRRVIYRRRRDTLFSSLEDTVETIKGYNKQTVEDIVDGQTGEDGAVDVTKVLEKIGQFFPPVAPLVTLGDIAGLGADGVKTFVTVAVEEVFRAKMEELDRKAKADGRPMMSLARSANYITLVTMDNAWSDHLQMMEDLKESVVLRKYQNLDPVAEYKNEAFLLFQGLGDKMRFNAVFSLWQSL